MTPQEESSDLELLKSDITSRLRAVCAHFPDVEFEKLVDQIARIETKYALRAISVSQTDAPSATPSP